MVNGHKYPVFIKAIMSISCTYSFRGSAFMYKALAISVLWTGPTISKCHDWPLLFQK